MGKVFLAHSKPQPVRASDAWVSPEGEFYPVRYAGHSEFCYQNEVEMMTLEEAGWLHLSGGNIYSASRNSTGAATQAQLDTLFDIAMAYQAESHSYFKDFQYALERLLEKTL